MVEPETDAARFWRFALRVYLPQAARQCFLQFQDESGGDVPMALFCLWCGSEGMALSEPAMRAAVGFSADWRTARVAPLRALRGAWKAMPGPLPPTLSEQARQHVAQAEQAVERLQMDHLVTLRDGESAGPDAVPSRANLDLYCRLGGLTVDDGVLASMVLHAR